MRLIPWGSAKLRSPTRSSLSTRDPIHSLELYLSILACNKQKQKKTQIFLYNIKQAKKSLDATGKEISSSDELTVEKDQICYKL